MFSEILKIIPKLENRELQNMERGLNKRFKRVAKTFGRGISAVFKGNALLAVGLAFINKILNPLKEVQAAIGATLTKGDDLSTFAKQFETDTGKLAKLVTLAGGSGLTDQDLFYLLTKFQGSLAAERAGTEKNGLGEFKDIKDTSDAFFQFIQSLKLAPKDQQVLVQERVFGERQVLKMSDFLNANFDELFRETGIGKYSSDKIGKSYEKLAGFSDLKDARFAGLALEDDVKSAALINRKTVDELVKAEKTRLERDRARLAAYDNLAALDNTVKEMFLLIEKTVFALGAGLKILTTKIQEIVAFVKTLQKSAWMRGILKYIPGGGN